jgi:hypothetical protein
MSESFEYIYKPESIDGTSNSSVDTKTLIKIIKQKISNNEIVQKYNSEIECRLNLLQAENTGIDIHKFLEGRHEIYFTNIDSIILETINEYKSDNLTENFYEHVIEKIVSHYASFDTSIANLRNDISFTEPKERFCSFCGKKLDVHAKFCGKCGAPQSQPPKVGIEKFHAFRILNVAFQHIINTFKKSRQSEFFLTAIPSNSATTFEEFRLEVWGIFLNQLGVKSMNDILTAIKQASRELKRLTDVPEILHYYSTIDKINHYFKTVIVKLDAMPFWECCGKKICDNFRSDNIAEFFIHNLDDVKQLHEEILLSLPQHTPRNTVDFIAFSTALNFSLDFSA